MLRLRWWGGATYGKKASEGSFDIIGTFYSSDITRYLSWWSRSVHGVLFLRKMCTFEIVGQSPPRTGSRRVLRDTGTRSNSSSMKPACPGPDARDCSASRHARRTPPSVVSAARVPPWLHSEPRAQPGMHMLWLRIKLKGHSQVCPRQRCTRPHTDSSVESSSGLMYSKPSNSDWSILFMTSSSSGVSCTGSLVNCVSKLSRP